MIYGRATDSDRWHRLVDGKPLCGVKVTIVDRDEAAPSIGWCFNCDKRMRRGYLRKKGGRAAAEKRSTSGSRTVYVPRHTFEDWDR